MSPAFPIQAGAVKRLSLRTTFSVAIALLVTVSLGLTTAVAILGSRQTVRQELVGANLTTAALVSRAVEQYLATALSLMQEARGRPKLSEEIRQQNWPEAARVLENFLGHFSQFDYAFVQDTRGIIQVRVPPAGTVGQDFSFRDFFREAMKTARPYVSGVYVSRAAERPVVSIAAPVLGEDGTVRGVLVGALSLGRLGRFVSTLGPDDRGHVYVVDARGTLVADSQGRGADSPVDLSAEPIVRAVLAGQSGTMELREPDGHALLAAHVPIPSLGWGVVVARSLSVAYAPAHRFGRWMLGIALGFMIGAIVLGWLLARMLTDPLQQINAAASQLATGDLSARTRVPHEAGDVGRLARTFDEMAGSLERQRAETEAAETRRRTAEASVARYAERLRVLHEIDAAIIAAEAPVAIAEAALRRLRELLGVPRAIVNLFDLAAGEVEWLAAVGRRRMHLGPGVRFPLALMGDLEALRRGEPQVIDTASLPRSAATEALLASGVHVYMVVPMIAGGELIGALSFGGASSEFPLEQVSIAQEAAAQLAIALAQARLHERVKRQAEELEQRVAERTVQLEAANRELEAFTYTISHDLKAPLRGMDGFARALQEDYGDRLDATATRYLGLIQAATRRMAELIDDLLRYSRLERRRVTRARVLLRPLVEQICGEVAEEIRARALTVVMELAVEAVEAEREGLREALANLIGNAVKFSRDPGGTITIGSRQEGDVVVVSVADTGIGFDMKYHDRIFGIFERLHRQEDYPGTGVGLAIVAKVAERHGGRAWAASEPGKGSTFFMALPNGVGAGA